MKFAAMTKEVPIDGAARIVQSPDSSRGMVLAALQQAKAYSDAGQYGEKHRLMRGLLGIVPDEFYVDEDRDNYLGLTHRPSGFRIHLPRAVVPAAVRRSATEAAEKVAGLPLRQGNTLFPAVLRGGDSPPSLTVEVAETEKNSADGLGGFTRLPPKYGMLFKNATSIWMRGCLIDLDLVYLTKEGQVTEIRRMTAPPMGAIPVSTHRPIIGLAQHSLELPAGWCELNDIRPGFRLEVEVG